MSFSPAILSVVNSTLDASFSVELFEYFPPQQQGSLKLKLVEVGPGLILFFLSDRGFWLKVITREFLRI
jgi:hypothetical protein